MQSTLMVTIVESLRYRGFLGTMELARAQAFRTRRLTVLNHSRMGYSERYFLA